MLDWKMNLLEAPLISTKSVSLLVEHNAFQQRLHHHLQSTSHFGMDYINSYGAQCISATIALFVDYGDVSRGILSLFIKYTRSHQGLYHSVIKHIKIHQLLGQPTTSITTLQAFLWTLWQICRRNCNGICLVSLCLFSLLTKQKSRDYILYFWLMQINHLIFMPFFSSIMTNVECLE